MSDVETAAKNIRSIFFRRTDNLNQILIKELGNIKTCDGKHVECCKKARRKIHWYKRLSYTDLALTMLLMLVIFGMCVFRSFNRVNKYGGCATNFLWPLDECPTAF